MRTCTVEGCSRPHRARGWCSTHWARWRHRDGDIDEPVFNHMRLCAVDSCRRKVKSRGWCEMHYYRWRRHGDPQVRVNNKGDDVGYRGVHWRLEWERGKARDHTCPCGAPADQWSYNHGDPSERLSDHGLPYTTNLDAYTARCNPCHRRYDA